MKNFEALQQMPLKSFAGIIFTAIKEQCETEKDFETFLEKEIPAELEGVMKEALQNVQCSSKN